MSCIIYYLQSNNSYNKKNIVYESTSKSTHDNQSIYKTPIVLSQASDDVQKILQEQYNVSHVNNLPWDIGIIPNCEQLSSPMTKIKSIKNSIVYEIY